MLILLFFDYVIFIFYILYFYCFQIILVILLLFITIMPEIFNSFIFLQFYIHFLCLCGIGKARARLSDMRRVRPSVCLSVCLSHAGVDSKLTTVGSCSLPSRVVQEIYPMSRGNPLGRASNATWTWVSKMATNAEF